MRAISSASRRALGACGLAGVEMVELGLVAEQRRRRGEAAGKIGDAVAVQKVALAVVLRMDQRVGLGDAGAETIARGAHRLGAAIGVGDGGEIDLAQLVAAAPVAVERRIGGLRAVAAGRAAEHARQVGAAAARLGQRIVGRLLVELGDAPHRHVEQRDLGLEDVAEQAGDAQGHVDARPVEHGQRQDFDAGDPARGLVPGRLHAEIPQRLREIVAAGAQRRRGPQVDDQRARRLAMILQVAAHDFVGGTHADGRRGAGRDGARIDRGEVAPRRQHVGAAARRRAGRTGRDAASVEGGDQRRTLAIAAGADGRLSSGRQRERLHRRLVGRAGRRRAGRRGC